ncbi:MAG: hypothetical protein PVI52_09810, partial [Chromatiales bacterium]
KIPHRPLYDIDIKSIFVVSFVLAQILLLPYPIMCVDDAQEVSTQNSGTAVNEVPLFPPPRRQRKFRFF